MQVSAFLHSENFFSLFRARANEYWPQQPKQKNKFQRLLWLLDGGIQLTTTSGGASSTRTISKNDVMSSDIGDLLTALSVHSLKLSPLSGAKIILPTTASQKVFDIYSRIWKISKELGVGKEQPYNGSQTSEPASATTTSTGDIKNEQAGDTLTTTTNNGQDTIKVDVNTGSKNAGGGWIKQRIQTGNKRK